MSTTPVNVQIPSDAEAPVIADFVEHALRVAYIDRTHLANLPAADWDSPGIYVLLTGDGTGRVYVGQARRIRARLMQHNSNEKLPWTRAVAVKRDTTDGFNTAEIGYLEGRVSAELAALTGIKVIEGQRSGDDTLPKHLMLSLDAFVKSILAALRLSGVNLARNNRDDDNDDPAQTNESRTTRTTFAVKFEELVSGGLIRAGETLYLKQGNKERHGTVTADGEIVVRGVAYKSPSAAAANALEVPSCNGWITWHIGKLNGPTLDKYRQDWLQQHQPAAAQ